MLELSTMQLKSGWHKFFMERLQALPLHVHCTSYRSHKVSRAHRSAKSMLLYVPMCCSSPSPSPSPFPYLVPSAPLNLTVSAISHHSANVTWSPPANPNGILLFYQLEYSIMGQSSMTLDVPAESLAASLVELTPAQVYQVTVRANTSVGFGSRSEPARATTEMDSECNHTHCTPTTHNTTHHTPKTQHYTSQYNNASTVQHSEHCMSIL